MNNRIRICFRFAVIAGGISSGFRHLRMNVAGLGLALSILSSPASAITMAPTAVGFGVDDNNISTLMPFGAQYTTGSAFLNDAIANSAFNNASWIFQFVNGTTTPFVPAADFTADPYSAWVVTNDPVTDPGGTTMQFRNINGADAGGANFGLTYTPQPMSTDPGAASIHFLQIFRESINGQAPTFVVDNGGAATPWYDTRGRSNIGINSSWMFDVSADCENGPQTPACMGATDEVRLSAAVDFQTFVAVDNLAGGVHTVNLYGGETWGYRYNNADACPHGLIQAATPATFGLTITSTFSEPALDPNITQGSQCAAYILTGINIQDPVDMFLTDVGTELPGGVISDALTIANSGPNVVICAVSDPFSGGDVTSTIDCPLVAPPVFVGMDAAAGGTIEAFARSTDGRNIHVSFTSDALSVVSASPCPIGSAQCSDTVRISVPEPSTLLLLAAGLLVLGGRPRHPLRTAGQDVRVLLLAIRRYRRPSWECRESLR